MNNDEQARMDRYAARYLTNKRNGDELKMSDGIKLAMVGIVCFTIIMIGVMIKDHMWSEQQNQLRLAACINPDSVACALTVRR